MSEEKRENTLKSKKTNEWSAGMKAKRIQQAKENGIGVVGKRGVHGPRARRLSEDKKGNT